MTRTNIRYIIPRWVLGSLPAGGITSFRKT